MLLVNVQFALSTCGMRQVESLLSGRVMFRNALMREGEDQHTHLEISHGGEMGSGLGQIDF